MRKLYAYAVGLLLAACFAFGIWSGAPRAQIGPPNQILCNQLATMAVGPSSITQLVAPVVGKTVFVCGWHVTNTGASGTFSFQTGTGSACGTGTATVVPATNVTSSAPSADHVEFAHWSGGLGNAVCVTPSVATISVVLFFTQV